MTKSGWYGERERHSLAKNGIKTANDRKLYESKSGVRVNKIKVRVEYDLSPDLSWIGEFSNTPKEGAIVHSNGGRTLKYFNPANPEYAQQEYEEMMNYENGNKSMLGIWVEAEIITPNHTVQKIKSGGLWGIESDSDSDYIESVIDDEVSNLNADLQAFGLSKTELKDIPIDTTEAYNTTNYKGD
jgi:hypothetical protein